MSGKTHWNLTSRPDMSDLTGDFGGRLISIICTSPTHLGIPLELQWRKEREKLTLLKNLPEIIPRIGQK
jgi:hypothetical protein